MSSKDNVISPTQDTTGGLRLEVIFCPHCEGQHIDYDEWAKKNHTRHLCEHCHRFFFTKPGNVGVKETQRSNTHEQTRIPGQEPDAEEDPDH